MAQDLDDGEFWLPSDFLTDEDLLMDFNIKPKKNGANPFYFNSDIASPVESVNGSTETESDEDDFIVGLTRKMAHSTLQGWKLSGSPQSTLSVSRVSSPPDSNDVGWELLYAAAGEVNRMRMMEETTPFHPPKPSPITISSQSQAQARLAYLQLQVSQFQRMKEQQMMRSRVWEQAKMETQFHNAKSQDPSMAAWPTLKQQSGSGMRAVFLAGNGAKKERTGTGVFLPRRVGTNPSATRKKPGCSSVLLPDRVVHALNLNLGSIDAQSQHMRSHGNFTPEYGAALRYGSSAAIFAEQRGYIFQRVMNQEFRLPQEWTC